MAVQHAAHHPSPASGSAREALRKCAVAAAFLIFLTASPAAPPLPQAQILDSRLIWGRGAQNEATDLLYHRDRWYCVVRETAAQDPVAGTLRILSSPDTKLWQPSALIREQESDLRRPSLSSAPDGKLVLSAVAQSTAMAGPPPRTLMWTSPDGRQWSEPVQAGPDGVRLDAPRWHMNRAYSFGFDVWGKEPVRLYSTAGGGPYSVHSESAAPPHGGSGASSALLFLRDGAALAVIGNGDPKSPSLLGQSRPPYRAWNWTRLAPGLAVYALLEMEDGRILAAGSVGPPDAGISLCWLDAAGAGWKEFLRIPAKGFSGSAGFTLHEGLLWISYPSSHEGRSMIYLAQIQLPKTR